jgi:hypothetical protein
MWRVVFIVVSPEAKTVTRFFPEQPEDRDIEAAGAQLGQWASCSVTPPN